MTDREVMQQALEALQNCANGEDDVLLTRDALADLRAALEQQQAEPVTCGYDETTGNCTKNPCCHPTPPQRQWVGLTDEDYLNALDLHPYEGTDREFWNVLETKLKEKNT